MITDFDLNNLSDIEDSLDFNTSQFIKTINDSYKKSFEVTIFIIINVYIHNYSIIITE